MKAGSVIWALMIFLTVLAEACDSLNDASQTDWHTRIYRGDFNHIAKEAAKGTKLAGLNIAVADQIDYQTYMIIEVLKNRYMSDSYNTYDKSDLD